MLSQDIKNLNVSALFKKKVKNNLSKLDEILDSIKLDEIFTRNIKDRLVLLHSCLKKINTYVIGFPELNEFEHSKIVANKYQTIHHEIFPAYYVLQMKSYPTLTKTCL